MNELKTKVSSWIKMFLTYTNNKKSSRLIYQLTPQTLDIILQVMNDEETFLAGGVVEKDESTLSNTRVANQVNKCIFYNINNVIRI